MVFPNRRYGIEGTYELKGVMLYLNESSWTFELNWLKLYVMKFELDLIL